MRENCCQTIRRRRVSFEHLSRIRRKVLIRIHTSSGGNVFPQFDQLEYTTRPNVVRRSWSFEKFSPRCSVSSEFYIRRLRDRATDIFRVEAGLAAKRNINTIQKHESEKHRCFRVWSFVVGLCWWPCVFARVYFRPKVAGSWAFPATREKTLSDPRAKRAERLERVNYRWFLSAESGELHSTF